MQISGKNMNQFVICNGEELFHAICENVGYIKNCMSNTSLNVLSNPDMCFAFCEKGTHDNGRLWTDLWLINKGT